MKKILCYFVFFMMIISTQSFAGKDGYICTILHVQVLHSSGSFNAIDSYLLGKSFSINRDTGAVDEKPFSNKKYNEMRVLNRGNEKDGYRHIVISPPPDDFFQYVYVREFRNGPSKPFWGTDEGDKVISGICK